MASTIKNARSADDTDLKLPTHLHDEVGMLAHAFEQKTKLLSELALYDSLTGLPNRKRFMDHLHEALNRANRKKYSLAVTYIDLNNFKEVNDKYGHDYGNELLVKFAYKLKTIARATDLYARLSGDEFAIISEDIQEDTNLDKFTSRLNRELNQAYEVKGIAIQVTIGAGLSLYPEYANSAEELMSQADEMMYQSKKEGKGKVHIYKPEKQS
ncbi:diguanylate cyclase domain-containing protein [Candidiatus Paracoxiella cheracis]|uniref:diguanylate cyclase domain-containing protein n=1 Tax=Candidiatus Paracoxiella cheracis TaxID=3405120 RepID=UPI003BF606B4